MQFSTEDLAAMNRLDRLNLINSITGIKPANLIGTKSKDGRENLAIFSSVLHLGSNPGLLGFVTRPTGDVRRDTYENIQETHVYTINHVPFDLAANAHYTSAKFDQGVSEFDKCQFTPIYWPDFKAPFVKESPVQIGLHLVEEIPIQSNGPILMVGQIDFIQLQDEMIEDHFHLNLEQSGSAGISGLNTYYRLKKEQDFPYARVSELPDF